VVSLQITTRWQEVAAARWPDKQHTGDGPLAVLTADGQVRLFNARSMHEPGTDFDARYLCLVADPRNRYVDLRDYKEPPKPQPRVEHIITFRHKMDTEKD
jgi:hypothetical protein